MRRQRRQKLSCSVTHPSTAGERSGLLLPLDLYLLWLCRRRGRPGPQCSPDPSRPPILPPKPAGTEPPMGPPPSPPRSLTPPKRPRDSESGKSPSVNGRSINKRCQSWQDQPEEQQKGDERGEIWGRDGETEGSGRERKKGENDFNKALDIIRISHLSTPIPQKPVPLQNVRLCHLSH